MPEYEFWLLGFVWPAALVSTMLISLAFGPFRAMPTALLFAGLLCIGTAGTVAVVDP